MKRLTLVRHAKSSRDDPSLTDFDRPLSRRGKEDAPEMGRRLAERGVRPDVMITSPAKRARSTARRMARELGCPVEAVREDEAVYDANLSTLTQVVRGLDDAWGHVLLVGHNPGLSDLASLLASVPVGDLATCAVVDLRFDAGTWGEVAEGTGTVLFMDRPRRPL